jgi:hypothetical protein
MYKSACIVAVSLHFNWFGITECCVFLCIYNLITNFTLLYFRLSKGQRCHYGDWAKGLDSRQR